MWKRRYALSIFYSAIYSFGEEHYNSEIQAGQAHEQTIDDNDIAMSLSTATWRRRHSDELNTLSDSECGSSSGEDVNEDYSFDNDPTDHALINDDLMDDARSLFAEELLGEDFEREAANIGAS